MRTTRIITAICWFIVAVVLLGLAFWVLSGPVFGIRLGSWAPEWSLDFGQGDWERLTGPYEVVGAYSAGIAGVSAINIDWVTGEVTVKPGDTDEILITEYAQRELREGEKLHFETSGNVLTIRFRERGNLGRMPKKKLEILVPRELAESLDRLSIESVSADVSIDDMGAETLKARTASGGIRLSNVVAHKFDTFTTSGSITVTSARSDSRSLDSISGTIRVTDIITRTLDIDTTSGSINVSGAIDNADLDSVSGKITLDNSAPFSSLNGDTISGSMDLSGSFNRVDADSISGSISIRSISVPTQLKANTTSGSINVTIPNEGEITVYHSAVSGKFSSDVPVVMQGRGAQFEFSSISGSTKVLALD